MGGGEALTLVIYLIMCGGGASYSGSSTAPWLGSERNWGED